MWGGGGWGEGCLSAQLQARPCRCRGLKGERRCPCLDLKSVSIQRPLHRASRPPRPTRAATVSSPSWENAVSTPPTQDLTPAPHPAFRHLRSPLLSPPYSPVNHYKGKESLSPRRFSLEPRLDGSKLPYLYMFLRYWLQSEFLVWKTHPWYPRRVPLPPSNIFSDSSLAKRCWRAEDE